MRAFLVSVGITLTFVFACIGFTRLLVAVHAQNSAPELSMRQGSSTGVYKFSVDKIALVAGGQQIGYMDKDGNFTLTEPAFWKMIESHCVAVLTENHTVHHKLEPSAPHFDDRTEWDEEIPEQTSKLRCQ